MINAKTISQKFIAWLEAQGIGTFNSTIYLDQVPDNSLDAIYWLTTSGGSPIQKLRTGEKVKQYFININYRSVSGRDVEEKLFRLEELLNCSTCVTLEGLEVLEVEANSFPTDTDLDNQERRVGLLQANIKYIRKRSANKMALVKGPFDVKWGTNTLVDISDLSIDFDQDSNDYSTLANTRYTIDGAISASVTITFLASDVPALAAVLPQFYVANGSKLSSGENVTAAEGAIDIKAASCSTDPVYNDLDIIACGTNANIFRLKRARTKVDGAELADNAVRTVSVQFIGEPASGVGAIQMFRKNSVTAVS